MEKKVTTPKEIIDMSMINVFGHEMNIYGVILIILFAIFLIALWRAQRAQRLNWLDMLTRDGTKVSTTKILQLVGGVVGTWIIIQVTLQGTLTWDLFAIYLAYVASIDGFSKFILARYGAEGSDDSSAPYRPRRYSYDYESYRENDRLGKYQRNSRNFRNNEQIEENVERINSGAAKADFD